MKTQKEIFESIFELNQFSSRKEMYEYIANEFCASVHTVNKWCSGIIGVNYVQMQQIVHHFKLSPADLFNDSPNWAIFNLRQIDMKDLSSYRVYMEHINNLLARAVNSSDAQIYFHADEIPVFHFMPYTNLTYFKLYAYAYDVIKLDHTYEEFCKYISKIKLEPVFRSISDNYNRIPSIEIWGDHVIDNILFQINHFEILQRFDSPRSKKILLDELMDLIKSFQVTATNGEKSTGKRFDFFRKPAPLRMGYMIIQAGNRRTLSLKSDTINSMTSRSHASVDFYYNSFRSSMNKSTALGIGAEGDRVQYFRSLCNKIYEAYSKDQKKRLK